MARGGSRSGAGRKSGNKNKATIERELRAKAVVAGAEEEGILPLDFMLKQMRDDTNPMDVRRDMAKAAAPYVHPKLATTEVKGDANAPQHHRHEIVWRIADATRNTDPA